VVSFAGACQEEDDKSLKPPLPTPGEGGWFDLPVLAADDTRAAWVGIDIFRLGGKGEVF